ncbi:MAG: phosphoribosylglycinamide formyltransferase [Gemmatimonadetes bacterium]|nr:MAG: phosphoribosylglycinamide formyltransferase [Gemmatimonadota bacterium]
MTHTAPEGQPTARLAVFASGSGSNLGALVDYFDALGPDAPATVVLVVSDRANAGALIRAAQRGIATATLNDTADSATLLERLGGHRVAAIALAGYLKLVPRAVTEAFAGRILNIHPALLPNHGGHGMYGARVHRAVLDAGDAVSGATVHFVDAEYDRGAPVVQARVPVFADDSPSQLAARVLVAEHYLYPRALHLVISHRLSLTSADGAERERIAATLFDNPPPGVTIVIPPIP